MAAWPLRRAGQIDTRTRWTSLSFSQESNPSPGRTADLLLTDLRPARLDPPRERIGALQADEHVAYVRAPADPGTRIARLTRSILSDLVDLAIDEGLIAVRMVGDVSVGPGVFANLDEALQRLPVNQQPGIRATNFPAGLQRPRQRASAPKRKQMRLAVIRDWNQERNRPG